MKTWAVLAVVVVTLTGCAINPATGKRQLSLVGEQQEVAMGRDADESVVASMGIYEAPQMGALVSRVGNKLAAASERPDLPWTFRIVDDPVVNAFALPGGYIYLTRGILAHFNSEAELAAVMGHEIGHVTARHSVNQMSKQQLLGGAYMLGMVFSEHVQRFGDIIGTGLSLAFLKFSRDDERQSDDLGLRYIQRVGYDPRPMADTFDTLRRISESSGGGSVPGWMSTHPAPENRRGRILANIGSAPTGGVLNRDSYVGLLEGFVFGEDPRQGYFKDGVFYHPTMRFRVDFPNDWKTRNQRTSVDGGAPEGDALIRITLASEDSAGAGAEAFLGQEGVTPGAAWNTSFNGLNGVSRNFQATTEGGTLRGLVAFVEHDGKVFRMLGLTEESNWSGHSNAIAEALGSFRELTDRAALSVKSKRIRIVRPSSSMSLSEVGRRHGSSVPVETLALINQLDPNSRVEEGQAVKVVTGGTIP